MSQKLHIVQLKIQAFFNPLNAELNPICHLLALVGARHIVHISRIRVKAATHICNTFLIQQLFNKI